MRRRALGWVQVAISLVFALPAVSACSPPPISIVSNPRSIVDVDPCHFFTDVEIGGLISGTGFGFPSSHLASEKFCQLGGAEGGVLVGLVQAAPNPGLFHDMIAGNAASIREHTGAGCSIIVAARTDTPRWELVYVNFDHVDHPPCKEAVPVVAAAFIRLPRP